MKKKLILGTANFTSSYGITGNVNKFNLKKIKSFNKIMKSNNIKEIDTAYSYKGVEKKIGNSPLRNYEIYSKFPEISKKKISRNYINRIINKSLLRLKKKKIKGIYFHGIKNLKRAEGKKIYDHLLLLKKRGIIKKIGVSVYSPSELRVVLKKFQFDMIQIPVNIFDRRFLANNFLKKIKNRGIEIHARSIFLQGILLFKTNKLPNYFKNWKNLFIKWENWNIYNKRKKIETCINFLNNLKYINKLFIGIKTPKELLEIIKILKKNKKDFPKKIFSYDKRLLEPRLWKKK